MIYANKRPVRVRYKRSVQLLGDGVAALIPRGERMLPALIVWAWCGK